MIIDNWVNEIRVFAMMMLVASTGIVKGQMVVGNVINNQSNVTLDVNSCETAFNQFYATFNGLSQIEFDSIIISDNQLDSLDLPSINYYYRILLSSEKEVLFMDTRHPVKYINLTNDFVLDTTLLQVNGGAFSCAKKNCKGCNAKEAPQGNWSCTPSCTPIDSNKNTSCTYSYSAINLGGGDWDSLLEGVIGVSQNLPVLVGQL